MSLTSSPLKSAFTVKNWFGSFCLKSCLVRSGVGFVHPAGNCCALHAVATRSRNTANPCFMARILRRRGIEVYVTVVQDLQRRV